MSGDDVDLGVCLRFKMVKDRILGFRFNFGYTVGFPAGIR